MSSKELRLSWLKPHSLLGIAEHLCEPLRHIYREIMHNHLSISPKSMVTGSLKVMNDTMGETV